MKTATKSQSRRDTRRKKHRWSGRVTRTSHAMDLEPGVFKNSDPKKIAASVKRSAESSTRRKSDPYRSAVSMISFFENRAGKNLPATKKQTLQRAKQELKRKFGRAK